MIKVNLLRDQTVRVRKTAVKPSVFGMGLVFLAVFLILFGGLGSWWYSINHEVKDLTEMRDRLQAENTRLQALKKEVDRHEKLKLLRQSRIDVIEKLKENQIGPVQLLNHLIQCIPHDSSIWLTLLDQKGDRIQIVGYALRPEAVPDFLSNLTATGFFKSVDLELLQSDKEASKFSLLCLSTRKQPTE
jgi:Tfp pilus assembly protein PilN